MLYCKYGFNKVVVWLWSQGCAQICVGGCGIMQLSQQVWWAKHVLLQAVIGNFLWFVTRMCWWHTAFDVCHQSLMSLWCNIILWCDDIISDVITHALGQVTWPFSIKGAALGRGLVPLPETFKRLDHLKHALVMMHQVHPCNWSQLCSTVLSMFSCVLSVTHVPIHMLKCSRKAQECRPFLN